MVQRLASFRLSEKEGGKMELNSTDIKRSREACEKSLVGRIYSGNGVNFTGLKQTMAKLWCVEGSLKVVELRNKMYQFFFTKEEERTRVLEKRPWTFDNQMLVIQPWKQDIDRDERAFHKSPMWVQVWQVPTQWLTSETIRKIGKIFAQCSNVIILENGSTEGRYAKMLVEVDLSKPLIRGTSIRFEGDRRWVMFKYELLPLFCFYCGKIGHGETFCEKKVDDTKKDNLLEGQFGEWLRANNFRLSNRGRETIPQSSGSRNRGS